MLRKQFLLPLLLLTSPAFLFSMLPKSEKKEQPTETKQTPPSYTLKELRERRFHKKANNSTSSKSFKQPTYKAKKQYKKITHQAKGHNFIYDNYTSRRGMPKMLDLFCDDCNEYLMSYQKDGPGRLLRCYLDRIHRPQELRNLQYDHFNVHTFPNLVCKKCRLIIGKPMIYKLENRPAYRMIKNHSYFKTN